LRERERKIINNINIKKKVSPAVEVERQQQQQQQQQQNKKKNKNSYVQKRAEKVKSVWKANPEDESTERRPPVGDG